MRSLPVRGMVGAMSHTVDEVLAELGGVARRTALLRVVGRRELDVAVESGLVLRDGRGVYSLPGADEAERLAAVLGGVLSHTSAALAHGWGVKVVPDRPHVTVSRGRHLGARALLAHVHRGELDRSEIVGGVTSQARTLADCLRTLPFDEALAVADSALRESGCHQLLQHVADTARGPGSPRIRRVAEAADGRAANPFESCLRAVCDDVPGLSVQPQFTIRHGSFAGCADLVDERLRVACEADSFEWHGGRAALCADARRYNQMVIGGWLVLRFTYEDVMFHQDEVRAVLVEVVALAELMTKVTRRGGSAA